MNLAKSMATLDSEKTIRVLVGKLGCESNRAKDHLWFTLKDTDGRVLSRTCISHGPRHNIGPNIVSKMAKQLKLEQSSNLVALVGCTKSRDECINIIRSASR